ncbi:MAG TPA: acyl-CoA dehydratase activase [Victivallales bacterium]|nr:acyl-CoA dehydratase activase [Victivallales bacterium]
MNIKPENYDGYEVGSVAVKWNRIHTDGTSEFKVIRHEGNPKGKLSEIINDYPNNIKNVTITGHLTKNFIKVCYHPETECVERAIKEHKLNLDMILALGGESFVVYTVKNGIIKNIFSSSKCAAGTGEFVIQQFQRMGYSLDEGLSDCKNGLKVNIATRCSVHCKSDATHKLNKRECFPKDIARSLVYDLAKKVSKLIDSSRWSSKKILLTGGLSLNTPFIEDLKSLLSGSDIMTVPESHYIEAFGASLISFDLNNNTKNTNNDQLVELIKDGGSLFKRHKPLKDFEHLLDFRPGDISDKTVQENVKYILGIDAGSTTTKAVLFNVDNMSVDADCYLRTNGNPVEATKKCLTALIKAIGNKTVNIIQASVTGSGREVVSVYLNNCHACNEILAHAKAAISELPEVDTVFEIGGQDSKYVSLINGTPVDYVMNDGCSAGTGSFLEETCAIDMNIPFTEISNCALKGKSPIVFGERCAAFINTDLRNALQQGAEINNVVAGLAYSIADNYISRLVNGRSIGDTIFFQGGVALNKSVALAIASRTDRKVVVPAKPELMGCVGAALIVIDLMKKNIIVEQEYNLVEILHTELTTSGTFTCKSCKNMCEIKKINVRGKSFPFGGLCSKFDNQRHGKNNKEGNNLIKLRNELMFDKYGDVNLESIKKSIGLPLALSTYELFPFYAKLINELGYNVILGDPINEGNNKTLAPICYPGELVHGAVYSILNKNTDYIFLPDVLEVEDTENSYTRSYTCATTSVISGIIKNVFESSKDKILSPHIGISERMINTSRSEIVRICKVLNIDKNKAENAFNNALKYYNSYLTDYKNQALRILESVKKEPVIIFMGRPYSTFASNVNLSIPQKIISKGYNVVSSDVLPVLSGSVSVHPDNCWHYTQQLVNAVKYAKEKPNYYICFISCFSCGPDASVYHEIKTQLSGKPFCYLEIDSHTAHAGVETRIEAFLEIIKMNH